METQLRGKSIASNVATFIVGLVFVLIFTISCSKKCDGYEYGSEAQFCYNNLIENKCGGHKYNPETHYCSAGDIYGKSTFNFTDSRDNKTYKYVKCGGKEYNAFPGKGEEAQIY
jgi:hypothetical protein